MTAQLLARLISSGLRRSADRRRRGCRGRGSCAPTPSRRDRRGSSRSDRSPRRTAARTECPGAAFSGIRLTFDLTPASSFASRRASSGESLTPASSTYSNVMRLRFFSGNRLHASMISATPYFLLSGTSSPRCSSVGACSEIARFGITGSRASRSSAGSSPTVDSVMRRGDSAKPVLVGEDPQRLHRLVVVVQRLAHAHQHDVEAACRAWRARRRARAPGRRFRRPSGSGRAPSCRSGRRRTPSRSRPASRCRRSSPACPG